MSSSQSHRITIRFKPDEFALIQKKAGDEPISVFLRDLIFQEASQRRIKTQRRVGIDAKAAAVILARLGQHRLVAEFKTVARQVDHGVLDANDAELTALLECHEMLCEIRCLLMQAIGQKR